MCTVCMKPFMLMVSNCTALDSTLAVTKSLPTLEAV